MPVVIWAVLALRAGATSRVLTIVATVRNPPRITVEPRTGASAKASCLRRSSAAWRRISSRVSMSMGFSLARLCSAAGRIGVPLKVAKKLSWVSLNYTLGR